MSSPQRAKALTNRQSDLLDRLEALFLRNGFLNFTLTDLAAELSCSKSTLYAIARSKEQLAVQVVKHFFVKATAEVERAHSPGRSATEHLRRYLAAVSVQLGKASPTFIADMVSFEPTRSVYELNAASAAERVHQFILAGVRSGEFRPVHVEVTAAMVGVLIENIQRGVIEARTAVSHGESFAVLAEVLLGGLCAR
ncbi:MAG: TetR/AcrR family transcriptional regulator [Sciscionella sp.]